MNEMQERMTEDSKYSRDNPFDVPEGYFDAIEDRIEEKIRAEENKNVYGNKFILMVKPILGLAASFALAFFLIYYPITKILPKFLTQQTDKKTEELKWNENFLSDYGSLDENSFFLALTSREDSTKFASDEIIAFLTSELDDYEVYAEIIN